MVLRKWLFLHFLTDIKLQGNSLSMSVEPEQTWYTVCLEVKFKTKAENYRNVFQTAIFNSLKERYTATFLDI